MYDGEFLFPVMQRNITSAALGSAQRVIVVFCTNRIMAHIFHSALPTKMRERTKTVPILLKKKERLEDSSVEVLTGNPTCGECNLTPQSALCTRYARYARYAR